MKLCCSGEWKVVRRSGGVKDRADVSPYFDWLSRPRRV